MMENDIPGRSGGRALPSADVLDPGAGELPPELLPARLGPVVLLLNSASDPDWAADAALAIARRTAREGGRVVLADLHLEDPFLHDRLGEENLEGVTDIFLYGASLARSARPVRGSGFYLIPAGTYTPDPEEVFRHPRWRKLATGFGDANASLLVFAPASSPGVKALARWCSDAIVLSDTADAAGATGLLPEQVAVRAVFAPERAQRTVREPDLAREPDFERTGTHEISHMEHSPGAREVPYFEEESEAEDEPVYTPAHDAAWDEEEPAPISGAPVREPGRTEPADAVAAAPVEDDSRRRRRKRGVGPAVWVAMGLIAVAAGTYVAFGARADFFGGWGRAATGPDLGERQVEAAPPAAPAAPVPVADTLSYAIQVRAYNALAPAQRQVEEQERRFPNATFIITPELTQGIRYYKVQAGFAGDTLAAAELRQRLVEARIVNPADAQDDAPGAWNLIQYRPLAFDLGEFATRPAAVAHADSLRERGVPSYLVALPYSDGSERWHLYGGAFADEERAGEMRQLLQEAGAEARLVPRLGRRGDAGG